MRQDLLLVSPLPCATQRKTRSRTLVPPPVLPHPDRWRLDQLLAWEERRMAQAEAAMEALAAPDRRHDAIADLLPQPKRQRRSA